MKNTDYLICENLSLKDGKLYFAGQDVAELAREYKTPLYLMDADRIRNRCRTYIDAANKAFNGIFHIMYAGKAAAFKGIYKILKEEDMYIDVVSCGEMLTAKEAGFPLERAYFHSCNKTDEDIFYGIENGVGYFVVDNEEELYAIDKISKSLGKVQNILLRLTPGIDPHTFSAVATGVIDSKFGFGISTGMAEDILRKALELESINLCGFHCHLGSQIFDRQVFIDGALIMLEFVAMAKSKYGFDTHELDLGGGIGVRYLSSQEAPDISDYILSLGEFLKEKCKELNIKLPLIGLEPGRSIVADAGMTLYTVGSVKKIPGYSNYVSVDGGMTDNVRYAMYEAPYTLVCPEKMNEDYSMKCYVVGRCCESGDIIQPDVMLPESIKRGDLIAVFTTGAYNYSMASNYNRIPRPALVMLEEGKASLAIRRETNEDLLRLDL